MDSESLLWQRVTYSNDSGVPMQRWGHKLVQTSSRQLLLFGGFGGEGNQGSYLGDLWEFDLEDSQWREFTTNGQQPQNRSNYTIHYNEHDHQVIIFGGGASSKIRFNSICILNLASRTWEKVMPDAAEEAPWERTYHCSEFHYPYLIVHGGEGVSNLDLDDTWTFNIITRRWKQLNFQGRIPKARRFHSSVMLGNQFYIIGGCRDNYELLGDVFKVNLNRLFQEEHAEGLKWEWVTAETRLERWGQSSCVFQGKVYIFAGRVNSTTDVNDLLVFDPVTKVISKLKIKEKHVPSARRRHASLIVGSSLLVFGGYNGKYLNDFTYVNLPHQSIPLHRANIISTASAEEMSSQLRSYEKKISCDWSFSLQHKNGFAKIQTNKNALLQNEFFACMLGYSKDGSLSFFLPEFCTLEMFRLIHLFLIQNDAIFCKTLTLQYYINLLKSAQYFLCSKLIPVIEEHLITMLTSDNSKQMLIYAVDFLLPSLELRAAKLCLKSKECEGFEENLTSNHLLCKEEDQEEDRLVLKTRVETVLSQVKQQLRFELSQARLRENPRGFLARTALSIKQLFSPNQDAQSQKALPEKDQNTQKKSGCLSKLVGFIARLGNGITQFGV